MPTNSKLYIGAMSGTSHDAVDVSLISVTKKNIKLEAFDSIKIPKNLSDDISNTISNNLISLSDLGVLNKKVGLIFAKAVSRIICLLYTSPSPRDRQKSRMPSSA